MKPLSKYIKEAFGDTLINMKNKYEFNRYANDFDSIDNNNYQNYIDHYYNSQNLQIKQVPQDKLKEIVYPNNVEPNEEAETGLWKFVDDVNEPDDTAEYYAFIYSDKRAQDVPVMFKMKGAQTEGLSDYYELQNVQVIKEFVEKITLKEIIQLIMSSDIIKDKVGIVCYKEENPDLYNKLSNDCGFEQDTIDNKNLCKIHIING